ncbi:MAG: energy-coupled thiamine transporter ThiT [Ruminococcus sp.]|nr:energy-coupled thiamine transporter ThiT [Candidatus Apopatosoma intestinale]
MKKNHVKKLTTCAVLIPMSVLLSFITLFHSPLGGSLTLFSMLPITLIGYLYGAKWGFGSAFVYAILQIAISPSTVSALFLPGEAQEVWWKAILICFLDYILAYTVLGFSSLFRSESHPARSLVSGTVVAILFRYLIHLISGALFTALGQNGILKILAT